MPRLPSTSLRTSAPCPNPYAKDSLSLMPCISPRKSATTPKAQLLPAQALGQHAPQLVPSPTHAIPVRTCAAWHAHPLNAAVTHVPNLHLHLIHTCLTHTAAAATLSGNSLLSVCHSRAAVVASATHPLQLLPAAMCCITSHARSTHTLLVRCKQKLHLHADYQQAHGSKLCQQLLLPRCRPKGHQPAAQS